MCGYDIVIIYDWFLFFYVYNNVFEEEKKNVWKILDFGVLIFLKKKKKCF